MTAADQLTAGSPPSEGAETTYAPEALRRYLRDVFMALGLRPADADLLAGHMVWADVRGISFLGLRKLPQYVARLRDGGTPARPEPSTVRETDSLVVVDCDGDWAMVTGHRVMLRVIEKARSQGLALGLLHNASNTGALGYYAAQAADAGMIGLTITNSAPLQTPPGAAVKTIGNQAFAVASPAGRHPPLLLDMATSAITLARIHDYESQGAPIPPGCALDASGAPTTDPAAALAGVLLPMAAHKGFGLATMWEVLTGVLAGGAQFAQDVRLPGESKHPQGLSVFMLVVDPSAVMPRTQFEGRIDTLIDAIQATPPLMAGGTIRVPGEQSHRIAQDRTREGIPYPAEVAASLAKIGADLGVAWPA